MSISRRTMLAAAATVPLLAARGVVRAAAPDLAALRDITTTAVQSIQRSAGHASRARRR